MIIYDKNKMTDVSAVGGKGLGLAKLVNYGCPVPDFFVITAGTVTDNDFAAELDGFAAALHCETFSVRSSGVNEDAEQNSFAGQYLTLLNVPRKDLFEAVKKVAASADKAQAQKYAEHFNAPRAEMAIVVQKQIHGARSGVLFTQSLYSSDELIIESVSGAGEQLVSGTVTPRKKIINKADLSDCEQYEKELVDIALRLEQKEGPLDLEWTYADKLYLLQMRPLTVLGDALPPIPQREWNFYVHRDFCVLAHSVQKRAAEREVQERLFGFSVPIYEGLLVNGREFYSEKSDGAALSAWQKLDSCEFFEKYICDIYALVKRIKRHAAKIKAKSFRDCGDKKLFSVYRRAMEDYIDSYVPLMLRPDDYLFKKLQTMTDDLSEVAEIVTPVWKKTYYSEEKADFLRAIISGGADMYLQKYEWINNPLGRAISPLTAADVQKRFERITARQAEQKLKTILSNRAQCKKRFIKYLENAESESQAALLKLISEFIFLRTYTAENSDRLFYYIRKNILSEISARFNISADELAFMTYDEICALERGKRLSQSDVAKRKSGELITFFDGKISSYYGGGAAELLARLMPCDGQSAILHGDVACPGECRGKVKIVTCFKDADRVEDGDIVVTSMTTPEIVCALERAGGIITDEGGITCHAAILAREYGLPCLVGTLYATKVLKDGTEVYLDCIHGKVEVN